MAYEEFAIRVIMKKDTGRNSKTLTDGHNFNIVYQYIVKE